MAAYFLRKNTFLKTDLSEEKVITDTPLNSLVRNAIVSLTARIKRLMISLIRGRDKDFHLCYYNNLDYENH